jgi:DNA polymerase-1
MATALFPPASPDVLYLIDLSGFVLRAYHAIQSALTSPSGEPTQAVFITLNMIEKTVREKRPALLAVAMDSGRETFRKQIFPEYKAHRPPQPPDLGQQMRRCEQIVQAFGIPILKEEGVEADDLIASAVACARARGLRAVVVASDKDLMQLVGDDVLMWDTMRDRVIGPAEVEERFGVRVDQLGDLLALMGDTSDNIPGVPSVGPKTAKEFLVEYQNLDGLYAHVDQIKRKAAREALITHKDSAYISRRLVELKSDCTLDFDLEKLRYQGKNPVRLKELYAELGFLQKLAQIEKEIAESANGGSKPPSAPVEHAHPVTLVAKAEYRTLADIAELEAFAAEAERAGRLSLEVALDLQDANRGRLIGLGLSIEPGRAVYVPIAHRYIGVPKQVAVSDMARVLGPLLSNPELKKAGLDLKMASVALDRAGITLEGYDFDAKLASYLLDPEARHDREALAQRELGIATPAFDELTKKGRAPRLGFDEIPVDEATEYAAASADFALRLAERLRPRLAESGLEKLYDEVELPLARLLAELERRGVRIDSDVLSSLGADCEAELARLEKEAHRIVGREFNVNSPRQLESILFDELKLKPLKRTKTSRSTDAKTLESLAEEHELPAVILEHRQVAKLKGTYIDALPSLVSKDDGRIHTSWEQAVAATGRLSSSDPNLQNIPIRSELGRKIRAAFVPPPGHAIVSADYSQIELRVLAHLSQDPVLLEAFRTGQDIHLRTAMEIFGVTEETVTREHRTRSKAVNFGVIYGQGDSGLAKALGIKRTEAAEFIAAYYRRYEGVRRFMAETLEKARAGEAVRSALGRRRLLPAIRSANRSERLAAERIAMNMPIQGTAADILKLAMLALRKPPTPGTRMILTVHDELVFEVPLDEVDAACAGIKSAMQGVFPLEVPLVVDVGHGPNWNSAH